LALFLLGKYRICSPQLFAGRASMKLVGELGLSALFCRYRVSGADANYRAYAVIVSRSLSAKALTPFKMGKRGLRQCLYELSRES
jgi:hypothetical protein